MSAPILYHARLVSGRLSELFPVHRLFQPLISHRCYGGYRGRRVLRVLTSDEAGKLAKGEKIKQDSNWTSTLEDANNFHKHNNQISKRMGEDLDDNAFRLPAGLEYEKLAAGDKQLGAVMLMAKSRKMREKKRLVVLEGKRLIIDAVRAGVMVKSLYFSKMEHLENIPFEEVCVAGAKLYKIRNQEMRLWSDVVTPSGIIAICQMPKQGDVLVAVEDILPITLICDNVRDPGNMGTIIRSAAAAGCQRILVTKGCVDIWEPKVVRAGMGSHFRISILNNLGWEVIGNYLPPDPNVYLADNKYVITERESVPRQFIEKIALTDRMDCYVETEVNEDTLEVQQIDNTFLDEETLETYSQVSLNAVPYYDVDYSKRESVVVVGGETQGLSAAAHKLAFERHGDRVYIPMATGVESLNCATAASIILFEVKRQLLEN